MSHFRRLSVRAVGDEAEPVRARLLELVPAGLEEVVDGDMVELAAYVPVASVDALLGEFPDAVVQPVPQGWEDAWRGFHHPVTVGGLWVGPPWEQAPDPARAVVIDPGRAFGTGAHPTTRLCVELLATTAERGSLLDVGLRLGRSRDRRRAPRVRAGLAVDVDPVAVETTRQRRCQRRRGRRPAARRRGRLASTGRPRGRQRPAAPVEVILGKLDADEAITSGYLAVERPSHEGWAHVETVTLDGWAADRFRRLR